MEASERPLVQRWHLVFSGEVQFVGFRYTARLLAQRHELTGWVKNLSDGRVEAEAQGETRQLRKFLLALKSQPHIRISHCEIAVIDPVADERRFSVRSAGLYD